VETGPGSSLISIDEPVETIDQKPESKLKERHSKKWLQGKNAEFSLNLQLAAQEIVGSNWPRCSVIQAW
jgi:hypothetical protein